MGELVATRAVGPPSHTDAASVPDDQGTPGVVAGHITHVDRPGDVAEGALWQGPYRKARPDLTCIRLLAASAIVAGLLLGTAPVALAQVGHLIATAPAAFVQEAPSQGPVGTAGLAAEQPSRQSDGVDRTIQYRSESHSVTPILGWKGTSRALRCSYGMLIDGDTRSCQAA
jgi:hypothetical protein